MTSQGQKGENDEESRKKVFPRSASRAPLALKNPEMTPLGIIAGSKEVVCSQRSSPRYVQIVELWIFT